jgi:hypothetical protein
MSQELIITKEKEFIVFDIKDIIKLIKLKNDENIKIIECYSEIVFECNYFLIIKKIIIENNKNINIFITYEKNNNKLFFSRGYVYKDDKEYKINHLVSYKLLQVGKISYENICICYLQK